MKHRVVRAILEELHRQRDADDDLYGGSRYIDDEHANDVCLDGWFDIERVADAVIKVMGEE